MAKVDYKALLEDLKRQRAEIDTMIEFAQRQISGSRTGVGGVEEIEPDTFTGKNILQGTEKYLSMVGRPARSTEEIAEALTKGGLNATRGSVATILGRSKGSKVLSVKRGLWGLKEWYNGG